MDAETEIFFDHVPAKAAQVAIDIPQPSEGTEMLHSIQVHPETPVRNRDKLINKERMIKGIPSYGLLDRLRRSFRQNIHIPAKTLSAVSCFYFSLLDTVAERLKRNLKTTHFQFISGPPKPRRWPTDLPIGGSFRMDNLYIEKQLQDDTLDERLVMIFELHHF